MAKFQFKSYNYKILPANVNWKENKSRAKYFVTNVTA